MLLPLQGALPIAITPRAMPWAKSFCPFRACCLYGVQLIPFLLHHSSAGKLIFASANLFLQITPRPSITPKYELHSWQ